MQELEYGATAGSADEPRNRRRSPAFDETKEMELATELLEVASDSELDRFLRRLSLRAAGPRGSPGAGAWDLLRSSLKEIARSLLALPAPARCKCDCTHGDVAAGRSTKRGALAASRLLGVELEGLSPEDQEFEVARRFVRLAASAAEAASRAPRGRAPTAVAGTALRHAARRHAPGLAVRPAEGSAREGGSGRWTRARRHVLLTLP